MFSVGRLSHGGRGMITTIAKVFHASGLRGFDQDREIVAAALLDRTGFLCLVRPWACVASG